METGSLDSQSESENQDPPVAWLGLVYRAAFTPGRLMTENIYNHLDRHYCIAPKEDDVNRIVWPAIQMCDALSRNLPKFAGGRGDPDSQPPGPCTAAVRECRRSFPHECRYVLEALASRLRAVGAKILARTLPAHVAFARTEFATSTQSA